MNVTLERFRAQLAYPRSDGCLTGDPPVDTPGDVFYRQKIRYNLRYFGIPRYGEADMSVHLPTGKR